MLRAPIRWPEGVFVPREGSSLSEITGPKKIEKHATSVKQ
jgi:hypothetical protein